MAKKLRIRFIVITMLSVVFVLGIIMLAINLSNYARVSAMADNTLALLAEGGGVFGNDLMPPVGDMPTDGPRENERRPFVDKRGDFTAETPFETRYFSVDFSSGIPAANTANIAAVDDDEAVQMAESVLEKGATSGYLRGQYRYLAVNDGQLVLFVDCQRQLLSARNFLQISLIVAAAGVLAVFILVFLLSGRAVKPIALAYERQKEFVTEASHELKTPITIISANNELLQMEYGDNDSTNAIEHEVSRLSSMVKNLVSLARLDEANTLAQTSPVNMSDCVLEQVELARSALLAEGRTLIVDVPDGVQCTGNAEMLAQLVSILLDNAAKYALTHTRVTLAGGKKTVLTVSNDATDLSDGDKSRCFERFYREAGARAQVEGSGIGLAIAKQIVQLHRGNATASASNGEFCVAITL